VSKKYKNHVPVKALTSPALAILSIACLTAGLAHTQAAAQETTAAPADIAPAMTLPSQALLKAPFMEYSVTAKTSSLPSVGAIFQPDQQFAFLAISPTVTVVTKADSLRRPRTFPESLPAETPMFQVKVDNGFAFCAFWGARQGVRDTQCFRDIDNNGTFDASYTTYRSIVGTSLYIGRIAGLAPMRPIAYETKVVDLPPDNITFRFLRVKDGVAEFKPQFGANRRGFAVIRCDLREPDGCSLAGSKFVFEPLGAGLKITSVTPGTGEFLLSSERPS
jgi:hypothetical protein